MSLPTLTDRTTPLEPVELDPPGRPFRDLTDTRGRPGAATLAHNSV